MKKYHGMLGFAVIFLAAIFTFSGCPNPSGDDTGGGGDPALTGSVSINGTAQVDETLTATVSGSNGTGTPTYQWVCGESTNIGTNQNTYNPIATDVGSSITVKVTYAGFSGELVSRPTEAVIAASGTDPATGPALTGSVVITGTSAVDSSLTAVVSGTNGDRVPGEPSFVNNPIFQWVRISAGGGAATNIGTNQSYYVPVAADVGSTIKVKVTYAGYSGLLESEPTAAVTEAQHVVAEEYRFTDGGWYDPVADATVESAVSALGETTFTVTGGGVTISFTGVWTAGGGSHLLGGESGTWAYLYGSSGKLGVIILHSNGSIKLNLGTVAQSPGNNYAGNNFNPMPVTDDILTSTNGQVWLPAP